MKLSEATSGSASRRHGGVRKPLAANDGWKEMSLRSMIVTGAGGLKGQGVRAVAEWSDSGMSIRSEQA